MAAGMSPEVQSGVAGLGRSRDDAVFPTAFRAKVPSSVDLMAGLPGDLSDLLIPFFFTGFRSQCQEAAQASSSVQLSAVAAQAL